ncbi:tau-tubulin kinase 1 [Anaeramoeba ignava]|uniref:Tau-tubulin kinase 1 n=1 Tax=Anaeramoeba ignava TaxID=1746090 RepID=A0A9Q0L7N9_ANAIG|nr:tau-tubulin kinase 1 [Anaeramoeba ignava]
MTEKIINNRWKLLNKIGKGGYGKIYTALDLQTNKKVAVKIERGTHKRQALKMERNVLYKYKDSPYAPDFIYFGNYEGSDYIVMELLGKNYTDLRRKQPNGIFSLQTTLKLGINMISAIEDLHNTGFIHRDIQPANFAIRIKENQDPKKNSFCCLFDYGLARRHLDENGEAREARRKTGFRGTNKFASINAHISIELSRRDDLWSLLFVLIEFYTRKLPWKNIEQKDKIIELKKKSISQELCKDLPNEFNSFYLHLNSLSYGDKPNYELLRNLLKNVYRRFLISEDMLLDWEISGNSLQNKSIPQNPKLKSKLKSKSKSKSKIKFKFK